MPRLQRRTTRARKALRVVLCATLVLMGFLPGTWLPRVARAASTGALAAGANAAVTTGAGDNDGFEVTPGNADGTVNLMTASSANTGSGNATDGCTTFNQSEDDAHDYSNFGFSIPTGASIDGIQVGTNGSWSTNTGTNQFCIELSWNGGTSWTSTHNTTGDLGVTASSVTLGGSANTWGRTWSASEFSNANFRLRVMIDPSSSNTTTGLLDQLTVNVTYTPDTTAPTPNPMIFSPGGYSVSSISFSPFTMDASATNAFDPTVTHDDEINGPISLPFTFTYFGINYTSIWIDTNVFIAFQNDTADALGNAGTAMPSSTAPNNYIVFSDGDMFESVVAGAKVRYETFGTSPNRTFVVDFLNISHCCDDNARITTQFQLHEGSNTVDIHTTTTALTDPSSPKTEGMEDSTGTTSATVSGRNGTLSSLSLTNDAQRFTPTTGGAPSNDSASQISMTAATATDATGPVSYLFQSDTASCGANAGTGGANSSFQAGLSYTNSGLQANKCYGYSVQARDAAGTPNLGTASATSTTYTSAATPGTPTLSGATSSTLNLTNAANGNSSSNPTTNFAVQVTTTSPTDATWLNKWVDASGNPSASAVWQSDAALDAITLHSLQASTTYGVKVKARNQDAEETSLSAEGQGTTLSSVSITLTTSGTVTYGTVAAGSTTSTITLSQTQTAKNDGGVAEDFTIKGQNTACPWTLAATTGTDQYVHEFSTNGGSSWTALTTSFQSFVSNIAANGTQTVDFRIKVPTSTGCFSQQSPNITIMAAAH